MPAEFKILNCDHAAYVVSSLPDALLFWVECMGAKVVRTATARGVALANITGVPEGAEADTAMIEIAGQRIELLEYRGVSPSGNRVHRPFDAGAMHVALNVDDVNAALSAVGKYGYRSQGTPHKGTSGATLIYVVGPDGATIEFMQPPAA